MGNPGDKYAHTRHNVGQDVVTDWAKDQGLVLKRLKSFGDVVKVPGRPLVLAVPAGYMNTSGAPVSALVRYFSTTPERVIVIHDDLDLPVGTLRLKRGGGHGGHNGLRDISKALGTPDFVRVRVGVGRPPGRMDPADYVLRRFATAEAADVDRVRGAAIDAAELFIAEGLEAAQQRFHQSG